MRILITGAAGNLGALLASHLLRTTPETLRLMVHRRDVPRELREAGTRVEIIRADLRKKETLRPALEKVDVVVHFAGILFQARPERFLPETNLGYFKNLVDVALECGVKKVVLISFPHVEGPTSVENPARGRMDVTPISVHAKTRLEEEKHLFGKIETPVSLRVGMVYGDGILMIDAARWLARRRLLGVWREQTQIHLISKIDFCEATTRALLNPDVKGIYHLGDEGNVSLQEFLKIACEAWRTPPPWIMPLWMIYAAATACECFSAVFSTKSPLTRDFIDIGRVSYYGDTTRMRRELQPELHYPTILDGRETLVKTGLLNGER